MKVFKFGSIVFSNKQGLQNAISIITNQPTPPCIIISGGKRLTNGLKTIALNACGGNFIENSPLQSNNSLTQFFVDHEGISSLTETDFNIESEITNLLDSIFLPLFPSYQEDASQYIKNLTGVLKGIELVREVSDRTLDSVLSYGEIISSIIFSNELTKNGIENNFQDSRQLIVTNKNFGKSKILYEESKARVIKAYELSNIPLILPGFIGATDDGRTTTLGRGGSDLTATMAGNFLNADSIEIYTKVNGIMSSNPEIVKNAITMPSISYDEAMELSSCGAQVIFPPSIQPAKDANIPIRVSNLLNLQNEGTSIVSEKNKVSSPYSIVGLSSILDVALIRLEGSGLVDTRGIAKRVFGAIEAVRANTILISQTFSEHSICIALRPKVVDRVLVSLKKEFSIEIASKEIDSISIDKDISLIGVVGDNMRKTPGISSKLFSVLARNGINVIAVSQGSSERNLSIAINKKDLSKAMNALHGDFFLDLNKTINIIQVGVGQVGATFIKQLEDNFEKVKEKHNINLKLVVVASSKKALINPDGIDLSTCLDQLNSIQNNLGKNKIFEIVKELNLPNMVFVDCSASEDVGKIYHEILSQSVSIVTPNKKANSSSYSYFRLLHQLSMIKNTKFLYETNVGAGLPIISTLSDLIASGDEVIKIEGILSGTLSYIFNNFNVGDKMSEVVKTAMESGYTEPDPRDDLGGSDVARKILILARVSGLALEESDVTVQSLIPDGIDPKATIDEFFEELSKKDDYYADLLNDAKQDNKELRYIATLEDSKINVELKAVDSNHPFFTLSGTDNIVSFTTSRYNTCPLVVKGPGAGTEVTAAGVFADVLRVASYL